MNKKIVWLLLIFLVLLTGTIFLVPRKVYEKTETVEPKIDNEVKATLPTDREVSELPIGNPKEIIIPQINVRAKVESVGVDDTGRMDVPSNEDDVAWWKFGPKLGSAGNSVIAGHYDKKDGGPSVFYNLSNLAIDDEINLEDSEGNLLTFEVVKKEIYKDSNFPLEAVFGASEEINLNLITCEGTFDKSTKNYSDRLVVFSRLKDIKKE